MGESGNGQDSLSAREECTELRPRCSSDCVEKRRLEDMLEAVWAEYA